jgi:hypothetical protein
MDVARYGKNLSYFKKEENILFKENNKFKNGVLKVML